MKLIEKLVYSSLVRAIDEYILTHKTKPGKIIMNLDTNKRLVQEIHPDNNGTVLEITRLFGMDIKIQKNYKNRELYHNEIIVLSK